ncbi:MAG: protein kinase [Planctomycetota bacterium]
MRYDHGDAERHRVDCSPLAAPVRPMAQLATFVFTDLVGSVRLKAQMPGGNAAERDAAYVQRVLGPHRELVERGLAEADGRVVSTAGDGHFLAFLDAGCAAEWALSLTHAHAARPLSEGSLGDNPGDARGQDAIAADVRVAIHVGAPQPDPADPNNYIGRAVDYAARLVDHAQGGQVLVSRTAAALIEDAGLAGVQVHHHGTLALRGIGDVEAHELLTDGRRPTPPRKTPSDAGPRNWTVLPHTIGLTEYAAQSDGSRPSGGEAIYKPLAVASSTAVRPRRIGSYELGELLGAGGMGNVYKARHSQLDHPRALKIIRPDLVEAGGDSVVRRFYQEVRATGALQHPNLVVAIDSSTPEDDQHYLVMEYVDGVGVDAMLQRDGPLGGSATGVSDACEIARQAALGLAHLADRGLVHRDVKPSNLMLSLVETAHLPQSSSSDAGGGGSAGSGRAAVVKLMDLGLALLAQPDEGRVTRMGHGGMGTGLYMPPEQWRTTSVDIRADLYSLGCTLWCLLTGQPPFADSDLRPERAHAIEPIPPMRLPGGRSAPPGLEALLRRLLAKSPEDRPQSPAEVAEGLAPLAAGHALLRRVTGEPRSANSSMAETRLGGAEGMIDTAERVAPSTAPAREASFTRRWLATWLATAAACGAVGLLAYQSAGWRQAMLDRHLSTLKATANLAAQLLTEQTDKRVRELKTLVKDRELREAIQQIERPGDEDDPASRRLQAWLNQHRADFNFATSSLFVTNAEGVQLGRSPRKSSIGKSYRTRDYFHGQGRELPEGSTPDPIERTSRSAVYQSSTTKELKVAFSTPVRSGGRTIGILAMSVALGEFAEFDQIESSVDEIEVLLADLGSDNLGGDPRRGLVLHHRDLRRVARGGKAVRLGDPLLQQIDAVGRSAIAATLEPYADPLGRESIDSPYWGAVADVESGDLATAGGAWVVIAQEPKP